MYEHNLGIRFQRVAEQSQKIALWFGERDTVDYQTLNKLANRIARLLMARGVGPGEVVCLSGEKSLNTFACLIACLKIGAAYCVLDPETPVERLRKILATCKPKLLLAAREFLERSKTVTGALGIETSKTDPNTIELEAEKYDYANLTQTNRVTGSNPAYIMFTSGSTGFPKAAVMTHANVLNLIEWARKTFAITPNDILTNVNPLFFDNSVFDLYSSLFTGARLVPFSKEETRDPRLLVEKIDAAACTLWFSVPSLLIFLQTMKATDGKHFRSIRSFIFGGEGYPKAKLNALYDTYAPASEFFNVYGPTECSCICSCYRVTGRDFENLQGILPLGRIADNFSFLILDDKGRKMRDGEIGELCLSGPNVGLGYYNDVERTGQSFVKNPENDKFTEIIYKTGDLVRLDTTDGLLYFEGRKDNQIKHMGYRIELEEIEAALHSLPYVSDAAVLHNHVNGLSQIVAVLAPEPLLDVDQIRRDLKPLIPDYMVPSIFHGETQLPRNPNGKVNRKYLAEKYGRRA